MTTLKKLAETFESRMIEAALSNNSKKIEKMIYEAELLYKEEFLTAFEYNVMTDIEQIKEIYIR